MKRFFLYISLTLFASFSFAQNEPELVGTFQSQTNSYNLVYIDHGMPKVLLKTATEFELYNTDLSLFATIPISEADSNSYNRLLFSRSLFDCDTTTLEYLSAGQSGTTQYSRIYRDDGTVFHDFGNLIPLVSISAAENERWVVSDENGSYMLFSESLFSSDFSMFRFCGQMPEPLARESNGNLITGIIEHESNGFNSYPNPAKDIVHFEYDLEGHKKANLQIFNTSGQLMKELMLGPAFDHIRLNVSDLDQGTYIARIVTDDGFELSEKFVKVE